MALSSLSSTSPSPPFPHSPLPRPRRTLTTPLAISRGPPSPTLSHRIPRRGTRERVSPLSAAPRESKWRTRVSFFPSFIKKRGKSREELKEELLAAIAPLDRGADAGPEDQERVDRIASELEAVNPIKEPLKSDLLNGKWELLYTTSSSILQTQRPTFLRPNGKIYQAINTDTLRAQNMETWPYFNQIVLGGPLRTPPTMPPARLMPLETPVTMAHADTTVMRKRMGKKKRKRKRNKDTHKGTGKRSW